MFSGLRNLFGKSKASIGDNSNHNIIVQNSDIIQPVICSGNTDTIKILGDLKAYEEAQKYIQAMLSEAKQIHPLYPDFSATYDNKLEALVSTPETEDALKRYPKSIKGTIVMDYTKYTHMGEDETPWEYAYRTQTPVEVQATDYREYLGNVEDPFPTMKYSDGMTISIMAPEFPPAVGAAISAGEVCIPFQLRRRPWLEYNELCFGSVSGECGLDIRMIAYKDRKEINISFSKVFGVGLDVQLQRERLLKEIGRTNTISIAIEGTKVINYSLRADEVQQGILRSAERIARYYECLLNIERILQCKFDASIVEFTQEDYETAMILSDSLEEKWHRFKSNFDNEIRCDYDHIPENLEDINYETSGIAFAGEEVNIALHGVEFSIGRCIAIYQGAKLNNLDSVLKNKKKKRKDILLTIRPDGGKEYFFRYCRFEKIKVVDSDL